MFKEVGKNIQRVDGYSLVKGNPVFTDDIDLKDMLFIKFLRSPHPHAVIKSIDTREAEKMAGVALVLTHQNTPRVPHTTAGQGYPEPSPYDSVMFPRKMRFVGDRVACVAAESPEIALDAVKKIDVEYKILSPVFNPEDALKDGAPIIHDEKDSSGILDPKHNLVGEVEVNVGNLDAGFGEADVVLENRYEAHYAQHTPIEPHIVITYLDENGRLVIRTSTQVPFHVRRICANVLGISIRKIRVIKPRIGGAFGTKQEVYLEYIAAYVTLQTERPAKFELTRSEEFTSRTRHPIITVLKVGARKDGTLTAIDMRILSNTGAYGSHATTVMYNTGSKVLPLYRCPNVRFEGKVVYTNLPVAGAYRGYGATQGYFATESMLDEIAEKIGMAPVDLRRKIHIKEGETSPIFDALGEGKKGIPQVISSSKLPLCIEEGFKLIKWKKKPKEEGKMKRGYGCAIMMQGSGIPAVDMGAATIKMNEDGSFNLLVGATDLGTGSDTILAQIAAETLKVPTERIIVYSSDTDFTPFDVGAYASSTTYISGGAVLKTARKVLEEIILIGEKMLNESKENLKVENGKVVSKKTNSSVTYREIACNALYETNQHQIIASMSHISHKSPPPFAAHFVEILINRGTGKIKVEKYVACVDCGTAINPKLAEGQVEGSIINGISYALTEEFIFNKNGKMRNASFRDYKIFTAMDIPEMKVVLIPSHEPSGPFGAKSVGEVCINGPCPAIANAIYDAVGVRIRKTPFTPERVLKAMGEIEHLKDIHKMENY
ncbi:aldehyde oxidase [candidate division WOR-3 bacterium JGI_Cruoil_03_44_89]|uniref:Aldehyde oxidase n=1 Tax=candidate division WOR-3 bacterium JGI_Cruoil_03_44_89 TaxID=1973748 RepID=A0A235BMW1_UNCW3|nr:MAG: aldehyde oxidase [candidate division WOR-3 bacterium JGI_Cruoil_03_44_89]